VEDGCLSSSAGSLLAMPASLHPGSALHARLSTVTGACSHEAKCGGESERRGSAVTRSRHQGVGEGETDGDGLGSQH
jgi:hypothetical protein